MANFFFFFTFCSQVLKVRLNIPRQVSIGFQAHTDTMLKSGSTAKNRFTVWHSQQYIVTSLLLHFGDVVTSDFCVRCVFTRLYVGERRLCFFFKQCYTETGISKHYLCLAFPNCKEGYMFNSKPELVCKEEFKKELYVIVWITNIYVCLYKVIFVLMAKMLDCCLV